MTHQMTQAQALDRLAFSDSDRWHYHPVECPHCSHVDLRIMCNQNCVIQRILSLGSIVRTFDKQPRDRRDRKPWLCTKCRKHFWYNTLGNKEKSYAKS